MINIDYMRYEIAYPFLNEALTINPDHIGILNSVASYHLFYEKNPRKSVQFLKRSLNLCDSTVRTYVLLGLAYMKLEQN